MTPLPLSTELLLIVIVISAAYFDLRSRRIPNRLIMVGLLSGILFNTVLFGLAGLRQAGLTFLIAFGSYFLLYLIHGIGAGDVKLMGAVGAIVASPLNWLSVFIFTAVLGGVLAITLLLSKGRLRQSLWNVAFIIRELISCRVPYLTRKELDVSDIRAVTLPHAAVIALGCLAFSGVSRTVI